MKILLLGGTGAMGTHLGEILSTRKQKVVITTRQQRNSKEFVEYRLGNAKDQSFLNNLLSEKWDVIVDFMIYSELEFKERVNDILKGTNQYMFLSSSRVYDNSEKLIKESSTRLLDTSVDNVYLSTSEYALRKARQEDILRLSGKRNWTIVRPYITYSEKRLQLGNLEKENWLYRALKGRTILFSEDIKKHFTTLTYGFDVANALVSLMNNPISLGEAYHMTSDNSYKWGEVLELYLDVIEKETQKRPKVILQELSDFCIWNRGKYQIMYDRLYDRKFDNKKINQFLNTSEFVDAKEGLMRCLRVFIQNPKFSKTSWRVEAQIDKVTKEKTSLSEIRSIKQKIIYIVFRYVL